MRSNDLVPLLAGLNKGPAVGFRQGVIVSWDPDTAANSVLVGDAVLENLPILNTSEAAILAEGDVVGILTAGQTWGILGRFTVPGTPEAVSSIQSITNRIQAATDNSNGTTTSTTYGDLTGTSVGPEVSIRIGSSGRALVFWGAEMGMATSGGVMTDQYKTTPHVSVELTGANSVSPDNAIALNVNLDHPGSGFPGTATAKFWIQCSAMHVFTGLTPGLTTFTLKYKHDGMTPNNACNFQSREIAVFAL